MATDTAKKFLVISYAHGLLPFAHRLGNEGHDVQVLIWKKRYERSWDGLLEKLLKASNKEINKDTLAPVVEAAKAGEIIIVTDWRDAEHYFGDAVHYFGTLGFPEAPVSPLRLGAWFDGEKYESPHLLIVDHGVWPGGLGANQEGGVTLVRADGNNVELVENLLAPFVDELKSASFKGLVQFGIEVDHNGDIAIKGKAAGWPFLHTHAFLSEMGGLGDLLDGGTPELKYKFTTALPVSLPPWPYLQGAAPKDIPIENLTPQQQGQVFWHDVVLDTEKKTIRSAGLDGLIGVVRGSADTHGLSLGKALSVAARMTFPEKQYRPDVGSSWRGVEANLEQAMGIVL